MKEFYIDVVSSLNDKPRLFVGDELITAIAVLIKCSVQNRDGLKDIGDTWKEFTDELEARGVLLPSLGYKKLYEQYPSQQWLQHIDGVLRR